MATPMHPGMAAMDNVHCTILRDDVAALRSLTSRAGDIIHSLPISHTHACRGVCFLCRALTNVVYSCGKFIICRNCYQGYTQIRAQLRAEACDEQFLQLYPVTLGVARTKVLRSFILAKFISLQWDTSLCVIGRCDACRVFHNDVLYEWRSPTRMCGHICEHCRDAVQLRVDAMIPWAVCVREVVSMLSVNDVRVVLSLIIYTVKIAQLAD